MAAEAGVPLLQPTDFVETAGRGVVALLEGARVVAGRLRWLEDNGAGSQFMEMGDSGDTQGLSLAHT